MKPPLLRAMGLFSGELRLLWKMAIEIVSFRVKMLDLSLAMLNYQKVIFNPLIRSYELPRKHHLAGNFRHKWDQPIRCFISSGIGLDSHFWLVTGLQDHELSKLPTSIDWYLIGLREKIQEHQIFHRKISGFL